MKNKTEFAIGEEVQMGLVTLVCTENRSESLCDDCYAEPFSDEQCDQILGDCQWYERTDKKSVIFKLKEE